MLAGRNGSGKSTLLRVLATALRPDRGSGAGRWATTCAATARRCAGASALLGHTRYLYEALTALREPARWPRASSGRDARPRRAAAACSSRWAWRDRADDAVSHVLRRHAQAALAGPRAAPGRRRSCCSTSPTASWTRPASRWWTGCSSALRARGATVLMATHLLERGRGALRRRRWSWRRAGWPGPARPPSCRGAAGRDGADGRERMLLAALRKDVAAAVADAARRCVAVFVFGATALLLFSFASGPTPRRLRAARRRASCGWRCCSRRP